MQNKEEQLNSLNDIRNLMQSSARFSAFNGLSVLSAGIIAIIGCIIVSMKLNIGIFEQSKSIELITTTPNKEVLYFLVSAALGVFLCALIAAFYFVGKKARIINMKLMGISGKNFIFNHTLFLVVGGLFCTILIYYGIYFLVVPSLLIFYGLGLINVSKFSLNTIRNLGIIEIALGITLAMIPSYALMFFMLGFGVMHVIYGLILHFNYDKK